MNTVDFETALTLAGEWSRFAAQDPTGKYASLLVHLEARVSELVDEQQHDRQRERQGAAPSDGPDGTDVLLALDRLVAGFVADPAYDPVADVCIYAPLSPAALQQLKATLDALDRLGAPREHGVRSGPRRASIGACVLAHVLFGKGRGHAQAKLLASGLTLFGEAAAAEATLRGLLGDEANQSLAQLVQKRARSAPGLYVDLLPGTPALRAPTPELRLVGRLRSELSDLARTVAAQGELLGSLTGHVAGQLHRIERLERWQPSHLVRSPEFRELLKGLVEEALLHHASPYSPSPMQARVPPRGSAVPSDRKPHARTLQ